MRIIEHDDILTLIYQKANTSLASSSYILESSCVALQATSNLLAYRLSHPNQVKRSFFDSASESFQSQDPDMY